MKSKEFDEFDRRILAALQHDSSKSLDELAKLSGLSRNACWRRVQHLESTKVIRKRVALLDPTLLGLSLGVIIHIRTNQHTGEWEKQFRDVVMNTDQIIAAFRTTGDIDYILHARVPDMAGYDALYKKLISSVPLYDVSAHFIMEELKASTELPIL